MKKSLIRLWRQAHSQVLVWYKAQNWAGEARPILDFIEVVADIHYTSRKTQVCDSKFEKYVFGLIDYPDHG